MTWVICGLLSAIAYACTTVLTKMAVEFIDHTLAAVLCSVIQTIVLIAFISYTGKAEATSPVLISSIAAYPQWYGLGLILLAALANGVSWIFSMSALKYGNVAGVLALESMSIIFCLVICRFLFGELLLTKHIIGACFIALGTIVLSR